MPEQNQPITALPIKTSSGMAATDYLLGIDSAEGYQMLIQDLGDYIIQHATSNLAGQSQTLATVISALNDKVFFASSSIKQLQVSQSGNNVVQIIAKDTNYLYCLNMNANGLSLRRYNHNWGDSTLMWTINKDS